MTERAKDGHAGAVLIAAVLLRRAVRAGRLGAGVLSWSFSAGGTAGAVRGPGYATAVATILRDLQHLDGQSEDVFDDVLGKVARDRLISPILSSGRR